jgi:hypothetical protein
MRLFCSALAISALLGSQAVAPTTAKTNLADALAGGKKWKADAILIQVVGTRIGPEGKNISWEYGFYSASAKTCAIVYVARGQSMAKESGEPATCQAPELKEFMDSDQAMGIARKNGITKPLASMAASVERSRPTWNVMDGGGTSSGDVIVEIDGVTGAILGKITQK